MKKAVLLVTFQFLFGIIYGQDFSYTFSSKKKGNSERPTFAKAASLPERYRALSIKFGPRTLDTKPGVITTAFIDDSPSQDNFYATTDIKDQYNSLGFHISYDWRRYSGLNHSIFFDVSLGDNKGGVFGYSIGWSIPLTGELIVRPALAGMFGNNSFKLGQIENNAGYIKIGNEEYTDNYLDVGLTGGVVLYGPEIDIRYILGDKIHLILNANYDIGSQQSNAPELEFTPPSNGRNQNTSSKKIDGSNPLVLYNGIKMTSMPYSVGGIRMSLGISYVWNKD
jgi:hypothetical protein